jgi:transposase
LSGVYVPWGTSRVYFERKVAEGKTKREAIRSLKRHVSNAVYRQLLIDTQKQGPGRTSGNDS